jgi:hypothetical protein
MPFNVNDFKSHLVGEGARNTLFQVEINFNGVSTPEFQDGFKFLCKAASLPASTVGVIEVPYFGRKIKVAGDRTFADWTTTIINLEDFGIRNTLEQWMSLINSHVGNVRAGDSLYKDCSALVTQYKKDGVSVAQQYKIENIWPAEVAAIDVDWNTTDSIEDFTVTWHYDWWTNINTDNQ